MDLSDYRTNERERQRAQDIAGIIQSCGPQFGKSALDIGARDGYYSKLMAEHFATVTALDLSRPNIHTENVSCIQGDICNLPCTNESFDFILCAEVLEHIPSNQLQSACSELERVCSDYLLIGVPYRQDLRIGCTTCYSCGQENPPWGHVNRFDEQRIYQLFPAFCSVTVSYAGKHKNSTNLLSYFLLHWAGNPFGTYHQEEKCVHCEALLLPPPERSFAKKVATKLAFIINKVQSLFVKEQPIWIHMLLQKKKDSSYTTGQSL